MRDNDSVIFYKSFAKAIKRLPPEEQLKAFWAIINYGLDGSEPEEDGAFMMIFDMAQPQIDANVKRKTDGCKGGRPSKTDGYENEKTTGYVNQKPNVKEKDKEKVNVKEKVKVNTTSSSDPIEDDSGNRIAASFVLADGSMYNVTENDVEYYQQLYPGIDCMTELGLIVAWCDANPDGRKSRSQAKRFLNSWFARNQKENQEKTMKNSTQKSEKKNAFINFEQRDTDYDALMLNQVKEWTSSAN